MPRDSRITHPDGRDGQWLEWVRELSAHWSALPQPTHILGSGCHGTAMATTSPGWVLKITDNPEEVSVLLKLLEDSPEACCEVLAVEEFSGGWLIWKEYCRPYKTDWTDELEDFARDLMDTGLGFVDVHPNNVGYNHQDKLVIFDP